MGRTEIRRAATTQAQEGTWIDLVTNKVYLGYFVDSRESLVSFNLIIPQGFRPIFRM